MARTRISAKGQVVLPKKIRDELGWTRGQELEVETAVDGIVLRPIRAGRDQRLERFLELEGLLAGTDVVKELEAEHRREIVRDERRARDHTHQGS